jgi:hypothetical protein
MDRRRYDETGYETGYVHRPGLVVVLAAAAYRFRWQLTPVFVTAPMPVVGWLTAFTYWVWPRWTLAAYVVAAVCAVVWVWHGLSLTYDRVLGAAVAGLCLSWMLAVAVQPGTGWLYGTWVVSWPLVGLFWWCGSAFRTGRTLAQLRGRWANVVELAGVGATKLIRARDTAVGRVIEAELPGDKTQRELSRERLEAALGARPGSVHLVKSTTNARRVTVHIVERDPWADGAEETHPAITAITAVMPAALQLPAGTRDTGEDQPSRPEVA